MRLLFTLLAATVASVTCQTDKGQQLQYDEAGQLAVNQSLFWGTWRPNLYLGMRARVPDSLMFGLIWYGVHDYASHAKARHSCEQDDGLAAYDWLRHDGRTSGAQIISDPLNNINLRTSFLKVPGGQHGGSWALKINGRAIDPMQPARIALTPYFGIEGSGSFELESKEAEDGILSPVVLNGQTGDLGSFSIRIEDGKSTVSVPVSSYQDEFGDRLSRYAYISRAVGKGQIWRAKDVIMSDAAQYGNALVEKYGQDNPPEPAQVLTLSNDARDGANLWAFQRMLEAPFTTYIYFDADDVPQKLTSQALEAGLEASKQAFDDRFERTFALTSKGYVGEHVMLAKSLLSNLIGGIGYFHGNSVVDRSRDFGDDLEDEGGVPVQPKPELTEERTLFTATPSRSFFPRGFYWDEGFHLSLIGAWDNDMSLDILRSWVDLIDENGWVGREQILGDEARSKVPSEFITQYPTYANPPTLTIAVTDYIARLRARGIDVTNADFDDRLKGAMPPVMAATGSTEELSNRLLSDTSLAKAFLLSIYPKLKLHYEWFRRTQRGEIREWDRDASHKTEGYRWRGRTADHVLTSGLDDYPRARPPHTGELHLDLISWVGFFSRTMSEIAAFIGEEEDKADYDEAYAAIVQNIDDLHWNEDEQMYCDLSVNEEDESVFVCHKGYISLFPFMLGLMAPDSPHLGSVLDLLRDPEHLWSDYGIRSLSKSDPYFGKGDGYWTGPIWIQFQAMILKALHQKYARYPGPHQQQAQQIYSELRNNVVNNVKKEYDRTQYSWEQYNALTGQGQRSHPFCGWTSMVTLIMAEIVVPQLDKSLANSSLDIMQEGGILPSNAPLHRPPSAESPGEKFSEEGKRQELQIKEQDLDASSYMTEEGDDTDEPHKYSLASLYIRFRALVHLVLVAVLLGWWISGLVLPRTRHYWIITTVWAWFFILLICFQWVPTSIFSDPIERSWNATVSRGFWSLSYMTRLSIGVVGLLALVLGSAFGVQSADSSYGHRAQGLFGLIVFMSALYLTSRSRKHIQADTVIVALAFQQIIALFVLKTGAGQSFFKWISTAARDLLMQGYAGAAFFWSEAFLSNNFFFVNTLSVIVFFVALVTLLLHYGILSWILVRFAWFFFKTLRISGAEAIAATACPFIGQGESAILCRQFVRSMTSSEIHLVMTSGFSTIAGSTFLAYVSLGVDPTILITSSVMSIPAAIAVSKMRWPERGHPLTAGKVHIPPDPDRAESGLVALSNGAIFGVKVASSIFANVLVVVSLLALVNGLLAWIFQFFSVQGLTLQFILGYILWPVVWLMGVPKQDIVAISQLIGLKVISNEFVAYTDLQPLRATLSTRGLIIVQYALCGFGNVASLGIQLGVLSALAPNQKRRIIRCGVSALICGIFTTLMTATTAGMLS
ncbi:glycoside hydrolase family 63 protein [Mixia osmundae IAM 14324]|uniref:Mannosyl-oligosaccharide glucosidase n=1 Tax=Mixia osmundae (strain CBS 9802 / IAM 14324 / JCM 22182 / KY 12970) TaxID=764103 RepID=G7DWN2_MIXOS|nr:glycoside hydrolase family 63 protein [Mixia osmundae IAM 14324]KEI37855.1 glycoside hydrolase family 63 protein [Mixia osmundae IAM 14324]GAA94992.1 hypothetical protein E5Q_01647 [Mixia osmundae IAM 14324]